MQPQIKYTSEARIVPFGSGTIRINNLTPVLTQKERDKRKREIEQQLFNIFNKYVRNQT